MTFDVRSEKRWHFTIIENEILDSESLNTYEKLLYVLLCRYSDRDHTKPVHPSYDTLAKLAGCSKRKAQDTIKDLAEKGYLRIESQYKENGAQSSNVYVLLPLDEISSDITGMQEVHGEGAGGAWGRVQEVLPNKKHLEQETSKQEQRDKYKRVAANAVAQTSNTLFDLPKAPVQLSPIEQARQSGDWKKVTDTEFLKYFIDQQNKIFAQQLSYSKSKQMNFAVSQFRKNLIDQYQIQKDDLCDVIDSLIRTYRETETDLRYRDCFSLETFNLAWKIDKLMQSIKRFEQYGRQGKTKKETETITGEQQYF